MTLAKIELRSLVKGFLIWTVLLGGVILLFTGFYPQIASEQMKTSLDEVMSSFSPEILEAFNLGDSSASLATATGFFSYYFQYLFVASAVYAMMLGTTSLIKEETDGTIEFLYAQPVTRKQIVLSKLLTNALVLSVFWLASYGISLLGLSIFKQSSDKMSEIIEALTTIFLGEYLLLLFFLALGFLLSTLLKSSKQGSGASLVIVFGFYLIGIFSDLSDNFSFLSNFSPIHMGIPAGLLEDGLVNGWIIATLLVVFIVGTLFLYDKKDLKI